MAKLIDKDALVAEIEKRQRELCVLSQSNDVELRKDAALQNGVYCSLLSLLDTLEVKEVDLMIHTIIAECCNWLAVHTELNHEQIEDCRNLMLTVKDEQLKAKQG